MFDYREYVAEQTIVSRLEVSLLCESKGYKCRIKFANDIIIYKEINKVEQHCCYKILQWVKIVEFDMLMISVSMFHCFY